MKGRRYILLASVLGVMLASSPAGSAHVQPGSSQLGAGPAPASCPTNIAATMTRVNNYWLAHNPDPKGVAWTTGTYFTGDMAAAVALPDQKYSTYALNWATSQKFALKGGPTDTNANEQVVGQAYIELYEANPKHPAGDISEINQSVATMVGSTSVDDWTWIDALFMSMPDFAELGVIEHKPAYFAKMYAEFANTKQTLGLWNASEGLWWRDQTFAGTNTYWSRGNGWVIAALARVLTALPATDPHRAAYVQTMQQMAATLKADQQADGFWYVNLADPTEYPGPETSGTALFTYALAWGIANGILDSATYMPVVLKAWKAMATTSVQSSGSLGYVQGPASGPSDGQPVTASSTGSYGVGAFLLAGSELSALCKAGSPDSPRLPSR